jgi:hypothetical protein
MESFCDYKVNCRNVHVRLNTAYEEDTLSNVHFEHWINDFGQLVINIKVENEKRQSYDEDSYCSDDESDSPIPQTLSEFEEYYEKHKDDTIDSDSEPMFLEESELELEEEEEEESESELESYSSEEEEEETESEEPSYHLQEDYSYNYDSSIEDIAHEEDLKNIREMLELNDDGSSNDGEDDELFQIKSKRGRIIRVCNS